MNWELYKKISEELGLPAVQLRGTKEERMSFFGGAPCTVEPFAWPMLGERPLSFLGQLDLKELNLDDSSPWLPQSGRLLFFYDIQEQPWGFELEDRHGWKVIYDDGVGELHSRPVPNSLGEDELIIQKFLRALPFKSIPNSERDLFDFNKLTESEKQDYWELNSELYDEKPMHQVGGYPEPVQSDEMEVECEYYFRLLGPWKGKKMDAEGRKILAAEPNDWKLLLQMDSDEVMWGDSGMLYFFVKESDARKRDFSKVWMHLQCC